MFVDCRQTENFDPDTMTCDWFFDGFGINEPDASGHVAAFLAPQNDIVNVTLTVSDGSASESITVPVRVLDVPPLVNAMDLEVVEGGSVVATCRYVDPGVFDAQMVSFDMGGGAVGPVTQVDEAEPALRSGFATQVFSAGERPAGTVVNALCDVNDDFGFSEDPFTITVVSADELANREGSGDGGQVQGENEDGETDQNSSIMAPVIRAGEERLGLIDSPDDLDVFQIKPAVGDMLTVGGEFVVNLTVPEDYDLLLFSRSSSADADASPFVNVPFVNVPFVNVPFVNVPFVNVPFVNVPFVNVPFVNVPFVNVPFVNVPFVNVPFTEGALNDSPFGGAGFVFRDFPLSQMEGAAPDGSQVSGSDIGLDELGSNNLGLLAGEGLTPVALSANPNDEEERVLVRVGPGIDSLFAAVVNSGGTFSGEPYLIRVEASIPPAQEKLLRGLCFPDVDLTGRTAEPVELRSQEEPLTLFITQRERVMAANDMSGEAFDEWMDDMEPFFSHEKVRAVVVSLPGDIYDTADTFPCRIKDQNALAAAIKDVIDDYVGSESSVEFVQLGGGFDIIPTFFVPDETAVGYEGLYPQDLLVKPFQPLVVGMAEGNQVTDAFYTDYVPTSFRGRELYIEDVSVSRAVETPDEILGEALAFVMADGLIDPSDSIVAGYDFFKDGSEATANALAYGGAGYVDQSLISDVWTGDDLRCQYFEEDLPVCPVAEVPPGPGISAINFHATYNGGISAAGFEAILDGEGGLNPREVFEASESLTVNPKGLTISIGCHAGLPMPDSWSLDEDGTLGFPIDPAQDWAQQPGALIAPMNYGLGDDTVADRGSEGLATLVAEQLGQRKTLGRALIDAKQRYLVRVFELDVHDEKSLIGYALSGMPQYALALPAPVDPPPPPTPGEEDGTLVLTVTDNLGAQPIELEPTYRRITKNTGEYFPLDGRAQGVVGRPLLPVALPIDALEPTADLIHDVAILNATFTDFEVDPIFAQPQHDWMTEVVEPRACIEAFAPSQLGIATSADVGNPTRTLESLIVLGAQFKCTLSETDQDDPDVPVTGELRRYSVLSVEAQRPTSTAFADDNVPPTVTEQILEATETSVDVTATLFVDDGPDPDASGLREIIALIYDVDDGPLPRTGSIRSERMTVVGDPPYTMTLPDAKGRPVGFQYIDNAGNVLLKTGKGKLIVPLVPLDAQVVTTDIVAGASVDLVFTLADADTLTDPTLTISFGDGSADTVALFDAAGTPLPGVSVAPDGTATVTVNHDYTGEAGPVLDIAVIARGSGREGTAAAMIGVTVLPADIDINGQVDIDDIRLILAARGQTVPPADPALDLNGDGVISIIDARTAMFLCTNPRCAP